MYDVMTEQDMTDTPQTEESAVLEPIQGQTAITQQPTGDVVIQSNESTKSDVFKPTPHMLVWVDTALRLMTDSVTDISADCGIDRSTWYNWLRNEQFRLWFKQEWDRRLAGDSWKLDVIGMKNAKRDHKYWQDMQRRVGNLTEKPGVAVQVNNIIPDDQLDRIIT